MAHRHLIHCAALRHRVKVSKVKESGTLLAIFSAITVASKHITRLNVQSKYWIHSSSMIVLHIVLQPTEFGWCSSQVVSKWQINIVKSQVNKVEYILIPSKFNETLLWEHFQISANHRCSFIFLGDFALLCKDNYRFLWRKKENLWLFALNLFGNIISFVILKQRYIIRFACFCSCPRRNFSGCQWWLFMRVK